MEDAQRKTAEEMQKQQQQQQSPTTQPGSQGPSPFPWRLASRFGDLPDQTVYLVMPAKA